MVTTRVLFSGRTCPFDHPRQRPAAGWICTHTHTQFDSTEMHEIAITWTQFDETEMYEVHTNYTRTAHNRMPFRRQLRARQRRHNQSSELAQGKPTASSEGSLAARRCGGAGEYLNGKNLHSLSLYLNG